MDRNIGEHGIVDVYLGTNPGGYVAEMMGTETFAIMTLTDREIIHQLCERRMNTILKLLKFLIKNNVGPFFSMDGNLMTMMARIPFQNHIGGKSLKWEEMILVLAVVARNIKNVVQRSKISKA